MVGSGGMCFSTFIDDSWEYKTERRRGMEWEQPVNAFVYVELMLIWKAIYGETFTEL